MSANQQARFVAEHALNSRYASLSHGLMVGLNFFFLLDGECIGIVEPVGADRGMGVVVGRFTPLPAYERVRPLFLRFAAVTRPRLAGDDEGAIEQFYRECDALNLSVATARGVPVEVEWLHIEDNSAVDQSLDAYIASFAVSSAAFFDDSRYWMQDNTG